MKRFSERFFFGAMLALTATLGGVRAQPLNHYVIGTQTDPAATVFFGSAIASSPRTNTPHVLAVADPLFGSNVGRVQLFPWNSAGGAAPLRTVNAPTGAGLFGTAIATGADFDGDGILDFVVGAPGATSTASGFLVAVSGAATPPASSPLPVALAGVQGDKNLGRGIAAAQIAGLLVFAVVGNSRVHYFEYRTSSNSWNLIHSTPTMSFVGATTTSAVPIVNLGTSNVPQLDDLAVPTTNGVRIIRPLVNTPIATITNPAVGFGAALAVPGDVTGNGRNDLLVGAPGAGSGQVFLYEGGNWQQPKRTWTGLVAGGGFGSSLGSGDFDGDGKIDYVVGAPGAGTVTLISGASNLAYLVAGAPPGRPAINFGGNVVGLGDLDGNGFDDYAMSSPSGGAGTVSATLIGSGGPIATVANLGEGCTCMAQPPSLTVGPGTRPRIGTSLPLTLLDVTSPNAPVVLAIGPAGFSEPCIHVAPNTLIPGLTLDGLGNMNTTLPIGASPSLMGIVMRAQCVVLAPCGSAYSNVLEGRVGL